MPLLSAELSSKPAATIKTVYEYDLETTAGAEYKISSNN
jgi:hypothetical protein